MKSRTLNDILGDVKSLVLANRLMWDYSPPEEKKDYITADNEAELVKKFNLPQWNENLALSFANSWSKWMAQQDDNKILQSRAFGQPTDFLKQIQSLLSNFSVSNKYLVSDAKESQDNLTQDGGVLGLCLQARALSEHLSLLLDYLKFRQASELKGDSVQQADQVPPNIREQYHAFYEAELKTYAEFDGSLKALSSMIHADGKNIDMEKFKEWFFFGK